MKFLITLIILLALLAIAILLLTSMMGNKETTDIDKIYKEEYVKRHTES